VLALVFLTPTTAAADILRLSNGRTMAVASCRFEGEFAILVLRNGGEIKAPRSLVEEILPDELPTSTSLALAALAASPTAILPRPPASVIRGLVDRVAARVGLDRKLAHAVVRTESNYEPLAVSPKGAMGLMQIMPVIVRTYSVVDPFDPESNLEAGMRHLRRLLARFDLTRALAAYNAGEGSVSRYGGVPPYRETEQYVRRVLASLR
jgi:soluble lytic murein transglycosylase-like protein